MKRYEKYKNSGVEWIGEIPEGWSVSSLQHAAETTTGLTFTKADLVEVGHPVISYGQIHSKSNTGTSLSDDLIRYIPDSLVEGRDSAKVGKGDFIFADTSEDLEGCGNCVYLDKDTSLYAGYHTTILRLKDKENGKYLSYLFKTNEWRSQLRSGVSGVKLYSITQGIVKSTKIILPTKEEQQAIASYLDSQCSKIDEMIEAKSKQIDDLKDYRKSLISEVVTKGLNPNVEMKESGVEWVGMIPNHWKVNKIQHVINLRSGESLQSESIKQEGEYPVFGGNGIRGFYSSYTNEGDFVLIGRQGALCGNINYAHGKFWATEHAVVCYPKTSVALLWLGELLRTMYLNQYSIASAQPGLAVERIKKLQMPVPPFEEQLAISEFLDDKCSKIEDLMKMLGDEIEELKKYKTSIISEAVTGKIRVC